MSLAKNWCFTLYEYTSVPVYESLPEWATYMVFQEEKCPKTERLHIQGYVQLVSQKRMTAMKKIMNSNTVHLSIARGSAKQNRLYCMKEETRNAGPWEYGEYIEKGSNKRKIMEKYKEDPDELRITDPKVYRRCLVADMNEDFKKIKLPTFDRPWQLIIDHMLKSEPDNRTIYWIYGSVGNEGKTTWAKGKVLDNWFYSRGGSGDRIKYNYLEHMGNAVFDYPRQSEDYTQYKCLEEIKDRLISSQFIEPITAHSRHDVHVVVLANFKPVMDAVYDDFGKVKFRQMLSADRLCLIDIDNNEVYKNGTYTSFTDLLIQIRANIGTEETSRRSNREVDPTDNTSDARDSHMSTSSQSNAMPPLEDVDAEQLALERQQLSSNVQSSGAANALRRKFHKDSDYIV